MKKVFKVLVAVAFVVCLMPIGIYAETSVLNLDNEENRKIHYIDNDSSDGKIVYEITEHEELYKVTEYIKNEYAEVISYIEKWQNDSYTLVYTNHSVMTEDGIRLDSYDCTKAETTSYFYKLNEGTEKVVLGQPDISLFYESTDWEYVDTTVGSNSFAKFTVGFVTQVITALVVPVSGVASAVTAVAISMIVDYIVDNAIEVIYYERDYYEKLSLEVPWVMVVGSKWVTRFYSDSARKNLINTTTEVVYLDGYEE